MIKIVVCAALIKLFGAVPAAFAQISGDYAPDLSGVRLANFDGALLDGAVSSAGFSVSLEHGITSKKISGWGSISASSLYDDGRLSIDSISGDVFFSASLAVRGSIVSLVGAKATLRNVNGWGSYDGYGVTVSSVTGAFSISPLTLNLSTGFISGTIQPGFLRASGYATDYPQIKRTITVRYTSETFNSDFSGFVSPSIELFGLITNARGGITGSATGSFGGFAPVSFRVTGARNGKTGWSTLNLSSTSPRGISAKLVLDDAGNLVSPPGRKLHSLSAFGYTLTF